MAIQVGQMVGRYHIIEQLGSGGMAKVFKAYDTRLEREVALKIIRTDIIGPTFQAQMLRRFEREGRALAKFTHPNIVQIMDFGDHDGAPYLVMAYLPGGTLQGRIKALAGRPMPYQEAARLLLPIARALEYAHAHEVIHRDVKPANILLTQDGIPMLTDFGIAKILGAEETTQLTNTNMGIGTPEYMAPEQWQGSVVPQTDIYALGVVLYELVTGRKPYTADTPAVVLLKQANEPLPRPKSFVSDLPDELEFVLFKALAKLPENRYQTMGEFAADLEHLSQRKIAKEKVGEPFLKWILIAGGLGLVLLCVIGLIIFGFSLTRSRSTDVAALPITRTPRITRTNTLIATTPPKPDETLLPPTQISSSTTTLTTNPTLRNFTPTPIPSLTLIQTSSLTPIPTTALLIKTSEKDGMTMLFIAAGEFLMGSTSKDLDYILSKCSDCDPTSFQDEKPQHTVYLDDFWIDQTEVTNAMYAKCVQAGACSVPWENGSWTFGSYFDNPKFNNYPVIWVDWNQAQNYCTWAGKHLPTEAQWEKAARGSDGRIFPWGNQSPNGQLLNFADKSSGLTWADKTIDDGYKDNSPVGHYPEGASPYGVLDMAGNVFEWVSDWFDAGYYSFSAKDNPLGPLSGTERAMRGGSRHDDFSKIRVAYRASLSPEKYGHDVGFRCVALP